MFTLDKLKNLFIYKNKIIRPAKDNNTNGTIIFNLNFEVDSLKYIMEYPLFKKNYFRSYYIPRKSNSSTLLAKRKEILPQVDIYKELKDKKYQFLNVFRIQPENYKGRNLIYDLSLELDLFFKLYEKKSFVEKSKLIIKVIQELLSLESFKEYNEKIVFIKINNTKDILKDMLVRDILDITTFICRSIKIGDLTDKSLPTDITFIFYNTTANSFIKGSLNDIIVDFSVFINKLKRISNNEIDEEVIDSKPDTPILIDKEEPVEIPSKIIAKDPTNLTGVGTNIKDRIKNNIMNLIGLDRFKDTQNSEIIDKIEIIKKSVYNFVDSESLNNMSEDEILDKLKQDFGFKKYLLDLEKTIHTTQSENKILMKILDERNELIKSHPIKSVEEIIQTTTPEKKQVFQNLLNPELKQIRSINKSYNTHFKKNTKLMVLDSFRKAKDIPFILTSFNEETTSTLADKKKTVKFTLKTDDNNVHNVTLDLPIVLNDEFLIINGNKKIILKQLVKLPITKIKPDEVELVTNYNKIIMGRFGGNISTDITRFNKLIEEYNFFKKYKGIIIQAGNAKRKNLGRKNSIEFDEISSHISSFINKDYSIIFNQKELEKTIEDNEILFEQYLLKVKDKENYKILGYHNSKKFLLVYDIYNSRVLEAVADKGEVDGFKVHSDSIIKFILDQLNQQFPEENLLPKFYEYSTSSKYIYSRASILSNKIPTAIIVGYDVGISEMLRMAKINYEFIPGRPKITVSDLVHNEILKLKDGYLKYEKDPFYNTLLLNGLKEMDLKSFTFEDLNGKIPYALYIEERLGSINIVKGIENFISLIIDPITESTLKYLNQPITISEILIYMNNLLENNEYKDPSDMTNYRIRGSEVIEAQLYRVIANAVKKYRDSKKSGMKKPKLEISKDDLMKEIINGVGVEEFSILNPILELESYGNSSMKGIGGTNLKKYGLYRSNSIM